MKLIVRHLPTFLIGTLLGSLIALGTSVFAGRESNAPAPAEISKIIPYDELRTFAEVFQRIKNDYVEPVEDKVLLEHAIQGMLSGLDPHSNYLNTEAYQELQIGTTGEFGGLGIEVGMENGFVKVIAPIDDTPAFRAGIKAGDMIIRLDDKAVKGLSLNDAVKVMRGKPGTPIKLTVVRENEDKPLQIEIIRDVIQVKSVKSRLLESGYGYVRISQFQAHTGEDLNAALEELKKSNNDNNLKGLVLDIRNNPGGVLQAAVAVSDAFLTDGLIVYTEGRVDDAHLKFKARPKDALEGAPIVVLVNSGSASASEIVAGALQDQKRAIIMGEKTFGKGSVQTIVGMNNNTALKLTTARYYTPSGRSIQAEGIEPDITLTKVDLSKAEKEDDAERVKEADLEGHLENGNMKKPSVAAEKADKVDQQLRQESGKDGKEDKAAPAKEDEKPLAKTDYAVHEALNLLKGLNIMNNVKKN